MGSLLASSPSPPPWLTLCAVAISRMAHLLTGAVRRVPDAVAGAILVALGLRLAADRS